MFDDAKAVLLSGRFLCRWNELDNLPAFFTGNPFHDSLELVWYVELDYFCYSHACFLF